MVGYDGSPLRPFTSLIHHHHVFTVLKPEIRPILRRVIHRDTASYVYSVGRHSYVAPQGQNDTATPYVNDEGFIAKRLLEQLEPGFVIFQLLLTNRHGHTL